nr:hypothetical protein [uncultured Devosia sp.]
MSDNSLHLVPVHQGDYPNARDKAHQALAFLVERDMVEAQPSDCTLATAPGHRFLPGARELFEDGDAIHLGLAVSGVSLECEGRRAFHPMESADLNLTCATCGRVHMFDEAVEFIPGWLSGEQEFPRCLACGTARHLAEWNCQPEWAFSNLGLTFWNGGTSSERSTSTAQSISSRSDSSRGYPGRTSPRLGSISREMSAMRSAKAIHSGGTPANEGVETIAKMATNRERFIIDGSTPSVYDFQRCISVLRPRPVDSDSRTDRVAPNRRVTCAACGE